MNYFSKNKKIDVVTWLSESQVKIAIFVVVIVFVAGLFFGGIGIIEQRGSTSLFAGFDIFGVRYVEAAISSPIVSFSGPSHTFSTEQVGGTDAHILIITNPGDAPDYKWQFLTNGLRLLIDRKGVEGWQPLISEIRTAPEYMKQQGAPGSFVWNSYGLNTVTSGSDVLQGFDKQVQGDGSMKFVRTYQTYEEGIEETLTEIWTIPADVEDIITEGPKVTYSMTKNRGIILDKEVLEGTWRMRWALSGIADITADDLNILDEEGWSIRRKLYSSGEFAINVNDFDNAEATSTALHSFSEIGANNKAEILFFKDGTTGDRVVDPTVVTEGVAGGWSHNKQRAVFYNGENFFLLYSIGDGSIYYKASSDNVTWTATSTVVSDQSTGVVMYDIYLVNDAKFDIVYEKSSNVIAVSTCTISSQTITCGNSDTTFGDTADYFFAIARTPSANRIYVAVRYGNEFMVWSADTAGDASTVSGWTDEVAASMSNVISPVTAVPYNDTDQVLALWVEDNGGTNSDGIYSITVADGSTGTRTAVIKGKDQEQVAHFGNAVRVSDSDFRMVVIDSNNSTSDTDDELSECTYGGSTWSCADIDTEADADNPSLFYDRISGDSYAFSIDTSSGDVERHKKTLGSWGTETVVDDGEAGTHYTPITQMHEPPLGSARTTPRELVWAYRVDSLFKVGNLNLAAAATVSISGTCKQNDQSANCTDTGTIKVAVNGTVQAQEQATVGASWTISGLTAPSANDIITVWIDGVASSEDRAVAVTKYGGSGDIASMELIEGRLSIGSDQNNTITNADLAWYSNSTSTDADIFFDVGSDNNLIVDVNGSITGEELYIAAGNTYRPDSASSGDVFTHDLENNGTITADGNLFGFNGSWDNNSTFTSNTSTVTATGTSETISHNSGTFNNLTIDPASAGTITVQDTDPIVSGTLTIASSDTLSIASGRSVTSDSTGTVTINGTISGAGTLVMQNSNLSTGNTLSSRVRFDATGAAITMPARTYGDVVEPYSSGVAGQVTLGSGTHTLSSALQPMADGAGDINVDASINNPDVNITGNLDFFGTGGGTEIIFTGTGVWTVSGNVDFTNGTFFILTTNTFIMDGSDKTLTSSGNTFADVILSGTITLADALSIAGDATLSGIIYPQEQPITLTGSSKTLTGGGTAGAVAIDGSYTLSGSDITVGTTTISTGSTLTLGSGLYYTSTSTLTLAGTLDGSGTTTIQHSSLSTGGTLDSNVRYDASSGDITTMTARTYGGNVEYYSNSSASARIITMGSGIFNLSGALWGNAANTQNITLAGNTNNPIVNASSTVSFIGAGGGTEIINAGSDTWTIDGVLNISNGTFTSSSGNLILQGDYTNSGGTFTHNSGTVTLSTTTVQQTLTGEMIDTDAFYNLTITNTWGGGDVTNTPSVIFANSASTTNNFTLITADTTVRFPAYATSTFTNIIWNGQGVGTPIKLSSSIPGTVWYLVNDGTQSTDYTNFWDVNACGGNTINAYNGIANLNVGNNSCIAFAGPTIASAVNQVFEINQTAGISPITVTDGAGGLITGNNNLRIAIATSSIGMLWDTTDTTASFSGSAWGDDVTNATVSYEGGDSVLVIQVANNFEEGDQLVIGGLSFVAGGTATSSVSVLNIYKDGAVDITSDANDSNTIAIKGKFAEADHSAIQENNKFTSSSVSGAELFAFNLSPTGENIYITNLIFTLSGLRGIVSGDITNATTTIDYGADGGIDAGDNSIAGGAAVVSITGGTGTITFATSYTATTTRNYILKADIANINPGDEMTINLDASGITSSGATSSESITVSGSASNSYHVRITGSGSGGGVGASPPAGDSEQAGGGSGAGENIGNSPGFNAPSALGAISNWSSPTSAYSSDGTPATAASNGLVQEYTGFGFSIPGSNTINGIEIRLEANDSSNGTIGAEFGIGTATTTSATATASMTGTDVIYTLGSPSDTFGRSWSPAEFNDGTFVLELTANTSGTINLDAVQVRVYHQAGGGGGGGGGEVYIPSQRLFASVVDAFKGLENFLVSFLFQ